MPKNNNAERRDLRRARAQERQVAYDALTPEQKQARNPNKQTPA